jgi:hypothetical protein
MTDISDLKTIPNLTNVEKLFCCKKKHFNKIPASLIDGSFYCSWDKLRSLPEIPNIKKFLYCHKRLKSIDTFSFPNLKYGTFHMVKTKDYSRSSYVLGNNKYLKIIPRLASSIS